MHTLRQLHCRRADLDGRTEVMPAEEDDTYAVGIRRNRSCRQQRLNVLIEWCELDPVRQVELIHPEIDRMLDGGRRKRRAGSRDHLPGVYARCQGMVHIPLGRSHFGDQRIIEINIV